MAWQVDRPTCLVGRMACLVDRSTCLVGRLATLVEGSTCLVERLPVSVPVPGQTENRAGARAGARSRVEQARVRSIFPMSIPALRPTDDDRRSILVRIATLVGTSPMKA